jgi:hypothetical protein
METVLAPQLLWLLLWWKDFWILKKKPLASFHFQIAAYPLCYCVTPSNPLLSCNFLAMIWCFPAST